MLLNKERARAIMSREHIDALMTGNICHNGSDRTVLILACGMTFQDHNRREV